MNNAVLRFLLIFGISALAAAVSVPAYSQETPKAESRANAVWEKMFPCGLLAKASQKASMAKKENLKLLKGKFVGIYHSASWCGYCHVFTPQLIKFHKKNKKDFEVVFIGGDKSEKQMQQYAKSAKMPWLAAPFGEKHSAPAAGGYPSLIVLTPNGEVLTTVSGANTKEKEDSRLHKDLRKKMNAWKKENGAQ